VKKSPATCPETPRADLWRFALACYARPGVEDACLQLQRAGADVCLLLCGVWLEAGGVGCSEARVTQLQSLAEPWQQEVVQPLRAIRTAWREAAGKDAELAALREAVKALELEAERTLLTRLQEAARQWPASGQQDDWLERLAPLAGPAGEPALSQLRAAAAAVQASPAG
jgi:uncharacterized protein (TIGR02444 family)